MQLGGLTGRVGAVGAGVLSSHFAVCALTCWKLNAESSAAAAAAARSVCLSGSSGGKFAGIHLPLD